MSELRDFYYLDSKLSESYLAQIEDGLIKYKSENKVNDKPNHSFEISTGKLNEILSSNLGIQLPNFSYSRDGKSEKVKIEEFKASNEVSQFSRLVRYLEPAMIDIKEKKDRELWGQLLENQFIKFYLINNTLHLYLTNRSKMSYSIN